MGKEAAEAIPALISALRSPDAQVSDEASWALAGLGDLVIADLGALATDADPATVRKALRTLGRTGDAAAVRVIVLFFKDRDSLVRRSVADALFRAGASAAPVVPEMIAALKAEADPTVRIRLMDALGHVGPGAKEAIPVLRRMANRNADPVARAVARQAVREIQGIP
jgi:HEAT repeat protein